MNQKTCTADDCAKLAQKRGFCSAHYQRERVAGRLPRVNGDPCAVDGCDRAHYAKGMCNTHYRRLRAHGDPEVLLKKPIRRTDTHKECVKCREMLPWDAFNRASQSTDGRQAMCRLCARSANGSWYDANRAKAREDAKRWNRENPEAAKTHHYKSRYGITNEEYERLREGQNSLCAICEKPQREGRPLYVDHDHYSGEVRGLLCHGCNTGLGGFRDNPDLLASAAHYLERPRC